MAKSSPSRSGDKSLIAKLTQWRAEFAAAYKRHAPDWKGQSYTTGQEYPHVARGKDNRGLVIFCDSLIRLLKATHSEKGYTMTERQLADFAMWYAAVEVLRIFRVPGHARTFIVGAHRTIDHPRKMRDKKAKESAGRKAENRERAEQAIKWAERRHPTASQDGKASFIVGKAAEHLGVNRSTVYRWLREPN